AQLAQSLEGIMKTPCPSRGRALRAITVALLCSSCSAAAPDPSAAASADGKADGVTSRRRFYVSASSVEALGGDLGSVQPAVVNFDSYLSPDSALGPAGPIGAWGPLGALGPVGDNTWNPSAWISAVSDWDSWRSSLEGADPLGEQGPLGPSGPLGAQAY